MERCVCEMNCIQDESRAEHSIGAAVTLRVGKGYGCGCGLGVGGRGGGGGGVARTRTREGGRQHEVVCVHLTAFGIKMFQVLHS